jgi:C-terminal processing protease CtpA/Prc
VVRGDTGWQEYSIYVPASKEARSLTVGALVIGGGTAWFDDLALGRAPEAASSDTDPREYVLEALSIMRENYLHADEVDWAKIRERGLGALSDNPNMAQTRAAVSMMVEALDDPHATTSGTPGSGNGEAEASEPVEHVDVEMVSEGIAMVRVPRVPGSTPEKARVRYADAAHRAMKSIDSPDLCGWVVDLRDNTGGNMWPMLAAIGPIAGPGVLGQFKGVEGSEVTEWVYRDGAALVSTGSDTVVRTAISAEPFEPANPDLPVAVLVSERTASSGEATAIAFIGRGNTRLFGSETGGLATANNGYPMPDGLRIVFPIGYMADRQGKIHHPAVQPDETVAPADAPERAVGWLKDRRDCVR